MDGSGNLYIAVWGGHVIRKVTAATGIITRVAGNGGFGYSGDGGPATTAQLRRTLSYGVAVDGIRQPIHRQLGPPRDPQGDGGDWHHHDGGREWKPGYSATEASPAPSSPVPGAWRWTAPAVYLADTGYYRIRKVAAAGTITTVAGNGRQYAYSGDGATATSAQFQLPHGATADSNGNVYIADYGNILIRKVASGTPPSRPRPAVRPAVMGGTKAWPPAPSSPNPTGVPVDSTGNLYIADQRQQP